MQAACPRPHSYLAAELVKWSNDPQSRLPNYTPHTPLPRPGPRTSQLCLWVSTPSALVPPTWLCVGPCTALTHHHPLCSISVVLSPASPFSSPLAALPIICLASSFKAPSVSPNLASSGVSPGLQLVHVHQAHLALWKPPAWSGGTRTQLTIPCGLSPDHPSR